MANGKLDEGVEKLQQFCTALAVTNDKLAASVDTFTSEAAQVTELDRLAQEEIGTLNDELVAHVQHLEAAENQATDGVDAVAESARAIDDDRLAAEESQLEAAESAFEERMDRDRSALESEFGELGDEGFEGLSDALEEAQGDLTEAGERDEQSFLDLEQDVADAQSTLEQSLSDGDQALAKVDKAIDDHYDRFHTEAIKAAEGWTTDIPAKLGEDGSEISADLEQLYEDWADELESEGDELMQAMTDLATDAATVVAADGGSRLQEAFVETTGKRAPGLYDDVEDTVAVLSTGAALAQALPPMVEDLVIVKATIADIERLLEALQ